MPDHVFRWGWRGYVTGLAFLLVSFLTYKAVTGSIPDKIMFTVVFFNSYFLLVGFPLLRVFVRDEVLYVQYFIMPFRNRTIPLKDIGAYRIFPGKYGGVQLFDRECNELLRLYNFFDYKPFGKWLKESRRTI